MIDSHCHIDQYPNPAGVAQEAERRGIHTVAVTNLPTHYEMGLPHLKGFTYVRLAVGMHPMLARKHAQEIGAFRRLSKQADFIGEIGLDFSREGKASQSEQVATFRNILACLQDRPRFMTLHSRGAASTVLDLLDEFHVGPVVFHWFTDSLGCLDRALELGHYFSVNLAMTQTKTGRAIVSRIPLSRLLTETDGPHVKAAGVSVRPTDIPVVISALAKLLNVVPAEVESATTANFMSLVSICQNRT